MPGFNFFDPVDALPLGWPDLHEVNTAFVKELCRLQASLTRRLRELRERSAQRAQSEVRRQSVLKTLTGPRRVYLHSQADQMVERDLVRRELAQDGIILLTAQSPSQNGLAGWQQESGARLEAARRCDALVLLRSGSEDQFVGDLLDIGIDERERIAVARGAAIPCAVLDGSGYELPIDVSPFGITRFDTKRDGWRSDFRRWIDDERMKGTAEA